MQFVPSCGNLLLMATLHTLKRSIANLSVPSYVKDIGAYIGQALDICEASGFKPVNEDGTPFSALFCGNTGTASVRLTGTKACLQIAWWGDKAHGVNGKYELAMYVL